MNQRQSDTSESDIANGKTADLGKEMNTTAGLYLDLIKRCLTNSIYGESEFTPISDCGLVRTLVLKWCASRGLHIVRKRYDPRVREEGRDRPVTAHTMIGLKRLDNLQYCVEDVLARGVPGDLIETGVWRGGATIFMRAILQAHAAKDPIVWVADSFEGLPPPDPEKFPLDAGDRHHTRKELAVSLEQVKANFACYGLLDDQVRFLKGWFRDTLPNAPIRQLAVLRLDGDMYESTMEALVNLYPKLSVGGYAIVDDYCNIPGCRQAVHDYRQTHDVTEEIMPIDQWGVFWRKIQQACPALSIPH
jgi:O-methyltransferase